MAPTRRSLRRFVAIVGLLVFLAVTGGCGVPQVLTPALPSSAGTVSVGRSLSQPFLSPANGLDGVTVAVSPPLGLDGELLPQPTGGARLSIHYAPNADNRFPEGAFHDWPTSDQWLGEITGNRAVGQSFLSRYPGLNGITLRVATYGADAGNGEGTLKGGPSIAVLALPIDGKQITTLPGGAAVQVTGTAEGWAHVQVSSNVEGYVPLDQFSALPPPSRSNTHDVVLTLYRESDMTKLRQVTINAAQVHDNSHVTFQFEPIPESNGQRYRFVVTSPDSTPGNAVTFRYSPDSTFADGQRYEGHQPVGGALIFRPTFSESSPIYQGNVDDFAWSSLTNAFIGSFPTKAGTAGRFLSIDLAPGSRTLNVNWSLARPSGGDPIVVDGSSQSPGGGLVFNVRYRDSVSFSGMIEESARTAWRDARNDPVFFGVYMLMVVGMVSWAGWYTARKRTDGR